MKRIMFNDRFGLTEAVIEKRKTVTRRLVKPPQWSKGIIIDSCGKLVAYGDDEDVDYINPPYKVGEIVAVAQNYREVWGHLKTTYGSSSSIARDFYRDYVLAGRISVSNKMYVKADLMPHRIRILSVAAEQLQDITEDDCLKEGVERLTWREREGYKHYCPEQRFDRKLLREGAPFCSTARASFSTLIDKISGKGTWNANPWVWRIEFELIK